MLSNITISNKTTVETNRFITSVTNRDDNIKLYSDSISPNPIMFGKLNARDNPTTTDNTLVINIDGKDYLTSELSARFSAGRVPVTFNFKDLVELDSVIEKTSLYDVVLKHPDDNTLEILGGFDEYPKYLKLSFGDIKTEEEIKQLELEYEEKNKDIGIQGFDISGIKINNTNICCNSLELFTDKNILKAKAVFIVSSVKFSGEKINTEATYYKEKEQKLVKYVFKPGDNLTTKYSDLVFYIDINVETQDSIDTKLNEAVSNKWKLYSVDDVLIN